MSLTTFLTKIEVAPHHESNKTIGGEFPETHSKVKDILFGVMCVILVVVMIVISFI